MALVADVGMVLLSVFFPSRGDPVVVVARLKPSSFLSVSVAARHLGLVSALPPRFASSASGLRRLQAGALSAEVDVNLHGLLVPSPDSFPALHPTALSKALWPTHRLGCWRGTF